MEKRTKERLKGAMLFLALAIPAAWLVFQWSLYASGRPHDLGFNPQETSNRFGGIWAIRMLILALAVSPAALMLGRPGLVRYRRMIGLYAFFYATLHLFSYFVLDLGLDGRALVEDILKRRYILFGILALSCLLPLAITSTKGWTRRLGARRWKRLHRLVYLAGMAAALHYLMLAKGNRLEPKVYAAILLLLLLVRIIPPALLPRLDPRTRKRHPRTEEESDRMPRVPGK